MPPVDVSYTGEFNAGAYVAALTTRSLLRVVRLTTDDGGRFYETPSGVIARVRADVSVRRATRGATATVFFHDDDEAPMGDLLTVDAGQSSKDHVASMKMPDPSDFVKPIYLGVRLDGSGEWDGFVKLTPYLLGGWEGVTLTGHDAMRQVEDDLFNDSVYPAPQDYTPEIRRAKADIRLRLMEADIEPDRVWSDGCAAAPLVDDEPQSPSGLGVMVVPSLVLPATYKAIAAAYARVTGFKDGRMADKADHYEELYDDAMRGAVKALLAVNEDGGAIMKAEQARPHRPRRIVL